MQFSRTITIWTLLTLFCVLLGGLPMDAHAQSTVEVADDLEGEDDSISLSNPLKDQEWMVDRLVFFRGAEAWDRATTSTRTRVAPEGPGRLVLDDQRSSAFPRRGSWISETIKADFPFTEVLPSWNVEAGPESGATFDIRVMDAESGEWSPWVYMGHWGKILHWPNRTLRYPGGEVHVDILKLKAPATAIQARISLTCWDLKVEDIPSVRQLTICYSGKAGSEEEFTKLRQAPRIDGPWARSLPVPFTPQRDNPESIGGSTCSPTSTNMVMGYRGVKLNVTDTAMGIYDPEYGIFGTWNRATAFAGQHGLRSHLTRMRSWEDVKAQIAKGNPVIASIKFGRNEFPSNVSRSSNGHLIVVRGLTPEGDAIVNDPASRDRGEGIVYKADELARAWFGRGGVSYIIEDSDLPVSLEASQ